MENPRLRPANENDPLPNNDNGSSLTSAEQAALDARLELAKAIKALEDEGGQRHEGTEA